MLRTWNSALLWGVVCAVGLAVACDGGSSKGSPDGGPVQDGGSSDGGGTTPDGGNPPLGLEAPLEQELAEDQAPDDDTRMKVDLTVGENGWSYSDQVETSAYTYNGQIPAPMIRAEVGQTLEISVTNELDEVTSIHFHGVDLPAHEDGSNFSQPGIPPGETWTYEYEVHQAMLAWFHPHFNTDRQISKGLYGLLLFEDPEQESDLAELGITEERTSYLALAHLLLGADDKQKPFFDEEDSGLTPMEKVEQVINGRTRVPSADQVAELVVNGKIADDEQPKTLHVEAGKPHRLRVLNASNGTMFRLAIHGPATSQRKPEVKVPFYRIGGEQGLLPKPIKIDPVRMIEPPGGHADGGMGHADGGAGAHGGEPHCHQQLAPSFEENEGVFLQSGERSDLVFVPPKDLPDGTELYLWTHDWKNGEHKALPKKNAADQIVTNDDGFPLVKSMFGHLEDDGCRPPRKLLRVKVHQSPDADEPAWEPPESLPRSWPIKKLDPSNVEKDPLLMAFGHAPPKEDGSLKLFVNVREREAMLEKVRNAIQAIEDGDPSTSPPKKISPKAHKPVPFGKATPSDAFNVHHGETRVWWVLNFTGAFHPVHMHGVPGQLLEIKKVNLTQETIKTIDRDFSVSRDIPEYEDVWKLPPRNGGMFKSFTLTKILMEFDDSKRPEDIRRNEDEMVAYGFRERELMSETRSDGTLTSPMSTGWAAHCHIESHIAGGMMAWYNLLPEGMALPDYLQR